MSTAKLGSVLLAAKPTLLIAIRLGNPAAGSPKSCVLTELDETKPWSVLTTCTLTTPCPREMVAGTGTMRVVVLNDDGVNGPKFTAPLAVATKKLTTEP